MQDGIDNKINRLKPEFFKDGKEYAPAINCLKSLEIKAGIFPLLKERGENFPAFTPLSEKADSEEEKFGDISAEEFPCKNSENGKSCSFFTGIKDNTAFCKYSGNPKPLLGIPFRTGECCQTKKWIDLFNLPF